MKNVAHILCFLFMAFIAAPSVIAYIDNTVDVSAAFNANEEETSSKNQLAFEFNLEKHSSNFESIHFLQEHEDISHYYRENYGAVFLDVISPPPQII